MALPKYYEAISHPTYRDAPIEKQKELNDRYWKAYETENPGDEWGQAQAEDSRRSLEAKDALSTAAPITARALELQRTATNARIVARNRDAAQAWASPEERQQFLAEANTSVEAEKAKLKKTFSLFKPEVEKEMQPAWEALKTTALEGGVFGERSVRADTMSGPMGNALAGQESQGAIKARKQYETYRDTLAKDFNLAPEEVDDLVKHRMGLQKDPVSRDALGQFHIKDELLAKGNQEVQAAIAQSNLPDKVKSDLSIEAPQHLARFKSGVVENVKKNHPELAADITWSGDTEKDYKALNDVLNTTRTEQFGSGVAAAAAGRGKLLGEEFGIRDVVFGNDPGSDVKVVRDSEGNVVRMEKAPTLADKAEASAKRIESVNQLSNFINQEKVRILGTDAATVGAGVYSGIESVAIGAVTGGLGTAIVSADRIKKAGTVGKILLGGTQRGLNTAPIASIYGLEQGIETYERTGDVGMSLLSAAIEGGVTTVFGAIKLGGTEDLGQRLANPAVRKAIGKSVGKAWIGFGVEVNKTITGEQLEEFTISALNDLYVESKLNPGMTVADMKKNLRDTAVATLFASGPMGAITAASEQGTNLFRSTAELTDDQAHNTADALYKAAAKKDFLEAETARRLEQAPSPERMAELRAEKDELTKNASSPEGTARLKEIEDEMRYGDVQDGGRAISRAGLERAARRRMEELQRERDGEGPQPEKIQLPDGTWVDNPDYSVFRFTGRTLSPQEQATLEALEEAFDGKEDEEIDHQALADIFNLVLKKPKKGAETKAPVVQMTREELQDSIAENSPEDVGRPLEDVAKERGVEIVEDQQPISPETKSEEVPVVPEEDPVRADKIKRLEEAGAAAQVIDWTEEDFATKWKGMPGNFVRKIKDIVFGKQQDEQDNQDTAGEQNAPQALQLPKVPVEPTTPTDAGTAGVDAQGTGTAEAKAEGEVDLVIDAADAALPEKAQDAVSRFTGFGVNAKENPDAFGIMDTTGIDKALDGRDPEVAAELENAFAPVREKLREQFGDTVTLFRAQDKSASDADKKKRQALSWTLNPDVADSFAGVSKVKDNFSEEEIQKAEKTFEETGRFEIRKGYWLEKKTDPAYGDYIAIMDTDVGGEVTDTLSVRDFLEGLNEDRTASRKINAKKAEQVRKEEIPLSDVVWVTNRGGQMEFIVRTSPNRPLDFAPKVSTASAEPAVELKAVRAKDFQTSGNYTVETPSGTRRIFRDPESGAWLDADRKAEGFPFSPFPNEFLGYTRKEALDRLAKETAPQTPTPQTNGQKESQKAQQGQVLTGEAAEAPTAVPTETLPADEAAPAEEAAPSAVAEAMPADVPVKPDLDASLEEIAQAALENPNDVNAAMLVFAAAGLRPASLPTQKAEPKMDDKGQLQLFQQGEDTARFTELTKDLPAKPTAADIAAFRESHPTEYAELVAMRERVLRDAGYKESGYHGTRAQWAVWDSDIAGGLINIGGSQEVAERYSRGAGGGRPQLAITEVEYYDGRRFTQQSDGKWTSGGEVFTTEQIQEDVDDGDAIPFIPNAEVKTLKFNAGNTLDLTTSEGKEVLSGLKYKTRLGQAIIADAKSGSFYWDSTKHEYWSKTWKNELVPQLKNLGYSSIKFKDDMHSTVAVFDPAQIKSADPLATDASGSLITPDQWGDTTNPSILYQDAQQPKGTYTPKAQAKAAGVSRAVLGLLEGKSDASTGIHEAGHALEDFLREIGEGDKADALEAWAKENVGDDWRKQREHIARGFERFVVNGVKTGVEAVDRAFARIAEIMLNIYIGVKGSSIDIDKAVKGSSIDIDIPPHIEKIFNDLLSRGAELEAAGKKPLTLPVDVVKTPKKKAAKPLPPKLQQPDVRGARRAINEETRKRYDLKKSGIVVEGHTEQKLVEDALADIAENENFEKASPEQREKLDAPPRVGRELVEHLLSSPDAPVVPRETALLVYESIQAENRVILARKRAESDKATASDIEKLQAAKEELQQVLDVLHSRGTRAGLALQAYKLVTDRQFNREIMLSDYAGWVNQGKPRSEWRSITKDEEQEIIKESDKIRELIKEKEELEAARLEAIAKQEQLQIENAQLKEQLVAKRERKAPERRSVTERVTERAQSARDRLAALGYGRRRVLEQRGEQKTVTFEEEANPDGGAPYSSREANTVFYVKDDSGKQVGVVWADKSGDIVEIVYAEINKKDRNKGYYASFLKRLSTKYDVVSDIPVNNAAKNTYIRLGAKEDFRSGQFTIKKGSLLTPKKLRQDPELSPEAVEAFGFGRGQVLEQRGEDQSSPSNSEHRNTWSKFAKRFLGSRVHPSEIPVIEGRFMRVSDMPASLRDIAMIGEVSHKLNREQDMAGNDVFDIITTPVETDTAWNDLDSAFRNKLRSLFAKRTEALERVKLQTKGLYTDSEIISEALKLPRVHDIEAQDNWLNVKQKSRPQTLRQDPEQRGERVNPLENHPDLGISIGSGIKDGSLENQVLNHSQRMQRGFPEIYATIQSSLPKALQAVGTYATGIRTAIYEHIGDLAHRAGSSEVGAMKDKIRRHALNYGNALTSKLNKEIEEQDENNAAFQIATRKEKAGGEYDIRAARNSPEYQEELSKSRSYNKLLDATYAAMYSRLQSFTPLQAAGRNMAIAFGMRRYALYHNLAAKVDEFFKAAEKAGIKSEDLYKLGFDVNGVGNLSRTNNELSQQWETNKKLIEAHLANGASSTMAERAQQQLREQIPHEDLASPIKLMDELIVGFGDMETAQRMVDDAAMGFGRSVLEQRGENQDVARFTELTKDLPAKPTAADIAAFRESHPTEYAELVAMRERVLRGMGYDVGPVFHGTRGEPFVTFTTNQAGRYFFAEDEAYAKRYAEGEYFASRSGNKPRVMSLYLKVENPIDLDKYMDGGYPDSVGDDVEGWVSAGFDGARSSEGGGTVQVFQPHQIKSADPLATDASGSLITPDQWGDTTSPSILRQSPELSPEAVEAFADLAAAYIIKGISPSEAIERLTAEYGNVVIDNDDKILDAAQAQLNKTAAGSRKKSPQELASLIDPDKDLSRQMIYNMAGGLLPKFRGDALINEILRLIQPVMPNVTFNDVVDAYTGYGKTKFLSKEEMATLQRKERRLQLITRQIGEIKEKRLPKLTGFQPDKLDPNDPDDQKIRRLTEERNQLMRDLELTEDSVDKDRMRGTLSAIKTRFKNDLADLQTAIDTNIALTKKEKRTSQTDTELEELKAQKKAKRAEYNAVFGINARQLSVEQRLAAAERALDKSIAEEEAMALKGELDRAKAPALPLTPAMKVKAAKLKALQDARHAEKRRLAKAAKDLLNPPKTDSEKWNESQQKQLQKTIDRFEYYLKNGKYPDKASGVAYTRSEIVEELLTLKNSLRDQVEEMQRRQRRTPRNILEARRRKRLIEKLKEAAMILEKQLEAGIYIVAKDKSGTTDPEIIAIRKANKALSDSVTLLKKADPNWVDTQQQKKDDALVKASEARTAKWEDMLAKGIFTEPQKIKRTPSKALETARFKEQKAKAAWLQRRLDLNFKNAKFSEKVERVLPALEAVRRAVVLGWDIAFGRQGLLPALMNRKLAATWVKVLSNMTEQAEFSAYQRWNDPERTPEMRLIQQFGNKQFKLYAPHEVIKLGREDIPSPELLDKLHKAVRNLPGIRNIPWLRALISTPTGTLVVLERANRMAHNEMSIGIVGQMLGKKKLSGAAATSQSDIDLAVATAMTAVRRGGFKSEDYDRGFALMNLFLISGRYLKSGLELATFQPIWTSRGGYKGTAKMRANIAWQLYGKSLLTFSAVAYALGKAAFGDDEEKWKRYINPLDNKFMVLEFNGVEYNFLKALTPYISLTAKLYTGYKVTNGKVVKLRGEGSQWGRTAEDEITTFLGNRRSLFLSLGMEALKGKHYDGSEVTAWSTLKKAFTNINVANDLDILKQEQVPAIQKALSVGLIHAAFDVRMKRAEKAAKASKDLKLKLNLDLNLKLKP